MLMPANCVAGDAPGTRDAAAAAACCCCCLISSGAANDDWYNSDRCLSTMLFALRDERAREEESRPPCASNNCVAGEATHAGLLSIEEEGADCNGPVAVGGRGDASRRRLTALPVLVRAPPLLELLIARARSKRGAAKGEERERRGATPRPFVRVVCPAEFKCRREQSPSGVAGWLSAAMQRREGQEEGDGRA
jgi:hypothetical protein